MNGKDQKHMARGACALLAVVLLAIVATACGGQSGTGGQAGSGGGGEPVRIANPTWIGYAGLWVAEDEGFFEDEGLNLETTTIEDPAQIQSAMKAGRLDGSGQTLDSMPRIRGKGVPSTVVLGIDRSKGSDGIIAEKGIESVDDLEGKTIAVQSESPSEWMLAQVLERNDMSLDDVETRNMTADQAGTAFAAGKVDVAVTWEPWLTKAGESGNGGVLVSTEKYPDIIVDAFTFTDTFIEERPEDLQAFLRAYDQGIQFIEENPERAYEIAAKRTGGTSEEVKAQLAGVELMDVTDSQKFMGTPEDPGQVSKIARNAGEFWSDQGMLENPPDTEEYIDTSAMANYGS